MTEKESVNFKIEQTEINQSEQKKDFFKKERKPQKLGRQKQKV